MYWHLLSFFGHVKIWVMSYVTILIVTFESLSFVTFWVFEFSNILSCHKLSCHNLSVWVLSKFWVLRFVIIWVSQFCHNLRFIFCHYLIWQKFDSLFLEPYSRNLELCFKKNWTWLPESFSTGDRMNINHQDRHK